MKTVEKEKHTLHTLKNSNCKLFKAILKNCDDRVIQALSEIIHNILSGNITVEGRTLKKLKRHKIELQRTHKKIKKNKSAKYRRRLYSNQTGGFWPVLLEAALSALGSYAVNQLAKNE